MNPTWKRVACLAAAITISGCVAYPKQTQLGTSNCGATVRRLELAVKPIPGAGCGGGNCALAYGLIGTTSLLVSGSIVVVGNTAFWIGENASCGIAALRNSDDWTRSLAQACRVEEQEAWGAVQVDGTPSAVADYLKEYPSGSHAAEAKEQLAKLDIHSDGSHSDKAR